MLVLLTLSLIFSGCAVFKETKQARDEAVKRMVAEAKKLKADAIVNVRFATSDIMQGAAEVMAYGTAVRLK